MMHSSPSLQVSVTVLVIVLVVIVCGKLFGADANTKRGNTTRGKASYYGEGYRGKPMSNGQRFDPDAFTCASYAYPLGTALKVTSVYSGAAVVVIVTDRGPDTRLGRLVDLSQRAFRKLAPLKIGIITVEIEVLPENLK